jgi:hypothetical protein
VSAGRANDDAFSHTFRFSLTADEFLYRNQWGEIALLTVGNLTEKILMANTTYVSLVLYLIAQSSFTFCREGGRRKKLLKSLNFCVGRTGRSSESKKQESFSGVGHLFAASFVIVDGESHLETDTTLLSVAYGFRGDFLSRFYIIKFIIKVFLIPQCPLEKINLEESIS